MTGTYLMLRRVRTGEFDNIPVTLEWEIETLYKVEEIYHGTNDSDDPSHCVVNERVKVVEDVGPFRRGDLLVLEDDERKEIEEEVLYEQE